MERKTLYSLGALVVLGVLAYFTLSTPEKGDRVGEKPRPVAEIKGDKVASIEVNQPVTQPVGLTVEMDYPDANGETLTASRRLTLEDLANGYPEEAPTK